MVQQNNAITLIREEAKQHDGVMIAFFLDAQTANQLAFPGGELPSQLHITLAFLGDRVDFTGDLENLKQILATFAQEQSALDGETTGIGRFTAFGEVSPADPIYASVSVKGLHELRDKLVQRLIMSNYQVSTDHAYIPHITLSYIALDEPSPDIRPLIDLHLDTLSLVYGNERCDFVLKPSASVQEEGDTSMSTKTQESTLPKSRIAEITIPFISDDAISRNKRQYPRETVDRLIQSGQNAIDRGEIINAYICHGVAEADNPLVIAGKVTRFWKEGTIGYAQLDMPDTSTGRDMVALLSGKYTPPTMSLRASGAEMKVVKGKAYPQVLGEGIQLHGLDFTMRPGIQSAQIQSLTLEAAGRDSASEYSDQFEAISTVVVEQSQEDTMTRKPATSDAAEVLQEPIVEAANTNLTPLVSGDSQSTDGTPGSAYTAKYPQLHASAPVNTLLQQTMQESQTTHDHVASALGMSCAPKTKTTETGRKFNQVAEGHMVAIHDLHATKLGLPCAGSYGNATQAASNDADGNTMESGVTPPPTPPQKEIKPMTMTPEQAKALLEASGFDVTPKKTDVQLLQEAFEAKLAQQQADFAASLATMQKEVEKQIGAAQPPAQRKTLVESTHTEQQPQHNSPRAHRSRIEESLMGADWTKLADRSEPLPDGVNPEGLLKHFGRLFVLDYQQKYGSQSIRVPANS